jgi:hypothetical protein
VGREDEELGTAVFQAGVETPILDGVSLRIYSPAKTIADCLKYRNKIGIRVAVEALRTLKDRGELDPAEVLHYTRSKPVTGAAPPRGLASQKKSPAFRRGFIW